MDRKTMVRGAMSAVLEDMGRAAREARSRRFNPKPSRATDAVHGTHGVPGADQEVDPVLSDADLAELGGDIEVEVQR